MNRTGGGVRGTTRAGALVAALVLAGCTTEVRPDPPAPSADPVALRVTTVHGGEAMDSEVRQQAESAVSDVLSEYVVQAFLGDYPRRDFVRSFGSFTEGLVERAARDIDLLTAARYSEADEVRATRLQADVSFLVRDNVVVGATAAVRFGFEAREDGQPHRLSMRGRLMLVERDGEWSVFGYDVTTNTGDGLEGTVEGTADTTAGGSM